MAAGPLTLASTEFPLVARVTDAVAVGLLLPAMGADTFLISGFDWPFGRASSRGKGNSIFLSVRALGVGLSIALRALSLSDAIRLLSSSSPRLGETESSSKTLVRSLEVVRPGEWYGGSSGPGVRSSGGAPSIHCAIAFASLSGPTGFATYPILHLVSEGEILRSNLVF